MIPIKLYLMIAAFALAAIIPTCATYKSMSNKVTEISKQCEVDKTAMIQQYKEALLNAKLESLTEHNKLLQDHKRITDAKNAEIKKVNANLDIALNSLRDRPSRPSPSASSASVPSTGNCEGATGSTLSREDAEFLTREASRADQIRIALDEAYSKYDSLRDKVNEMFKSQQGP